MSSSWLQVSHLALSWRLFGEKACGSCKRRGISGSKSPLFGREGEISKGKVAFLGGNDIAGGEKWEPVGKKILYWRATVVFLVCQVVSWGDNVVNRGDNVLWRSVK